MGFAGRPDVVDRVISVDGHPARKVSVLPRDFETPTLARAGLVVPQQVDDAMLARAVTGRPLRVLGRLRPGLTVAQLQAQGDAILAAELQSAHVHLPGASDIELRVRTLRDL